MKYILVALTLMLVLTAGRTYGQKFEFFGGIGYGQCKMQDLKDLNKLVQSETSFPTRIIDDFPSTVHYSGEFNINFSKVSVGLSYQFNTSGSRISYSDYSGEIRMDITVVGNSLGPSVMYPIFQNDKFRIGPRVQVPMIYSRTALKDYIRLYDEAVSDNIKYYSLSLGVLPSFVADYKLSHFRIGLKAGYLFDSKGRLVDDPEMTIYLNNHDYLTTDWSGLLIDLRIGYEF